MKSNKKQFKDELLREIKREVFRNQVTDEKYEQTKNYVDAAHEKCLEKIKKKNEAFKNKTITAKRPNPIKIPENIPEQARQAYEELKKINSNIKNTTIFEQVSINKLLYLLTYLRMSDPKNQKKDELSECLRRQHSEFPSFWDSPSYILAALRICLLERDWARMTRFLIILLNYDNKYISVVKNMCQVMLKLNPQIKQLGLEEQFKILTQPVESEITII